MTAWMEDALRSVLDKHRPKRERYFSGASATICRECRYDWPCATVQGIRDAAASTVEPLPEGWDQVAGNTPPAATIQDTMPAGNPTVNRWLEQQTHLGSVCQAWRHVDIHPEGPCAFILCPNQPAPITPPLHPRWDDNTTGDQTP